MLEMSLRRIGKEAESSKMELQPVYLPCAARSNYQLVIAAYVSMKRQYKAKTKAGVTRPKKMEVAVTMN
jgi:hypothetical protein